MAKILKPYEVPLDDELAAEILNIPVESSDEVTVEAPRTIGERVKQAIMAVEEANEFLAKSKLAALVADTVMRKLKKRGTPTLRVQPEGTVILRVSYDEGRESSEPPVASMASVASVTRKAKKSNLPTIAELRKRAEGVGVDITHLGRQRRAILELVQAAEEAAAEDSGEDVTPPDRLVDELGEGPPTSEEKPKTIRRKSKKTPSNGPGAEPVPPIADLTEPDAAGDIDIDQLMDDMGGESEDDPRKTLTG